MEEAGQGPGSEKSSPHERTGQPPLRPEGWWWWGGLGVMDVPCDWSPRHAHMETPPRPGQRSKQSKREAGGLG